MTTFLLARGNLQDIANRSDSFDIAKVYRDIVLVSESWKGSFFLNKKQDDFLNVLPFVRA